MKAAEKRDTPPRGLLDDVPAGLTGLARAVKLQKRAGTVGFDWNDPRAVLAKLREEIDEIAGELVPDEPDRRAVEAEIGDLLFAVANLARHLDIDPDRALRGANQKFIRRFRHIEERLGQAGRKPAEATLDEMEALWREAKEAEKAAAE
jgi:ATP diphosphatase